MTKFTKDPSTHPARSPLTEDRLIRVRDELAAAAKRSDGGNLGYMMADAAKAINELLARRKVEQEPVCHLTWHQGFRAPDDCEDYVIVAKPSDLSCDGSPAFPVYAAPQLPQPAVVPTFDEWCAATDNKPLGWVKDTMREAYDGCRAAMLQGNHRDLSYPVDPQVAEYEKIMQQAAPANSFTNKELEGMTCGDNPQANAYRELLAYRLSAAGWVPCSERMPDEIGRYWCYVEEQNSLGKSHYQWNCSWNGELWGGEMMYGLVTHWVPLPNPPKQNADC